MEMPESAQNNGESRRAERSERAVASLAEWSRNPSEPASNPLFAGCSCAALCRAKSQRYVSFDAIAGLRNGVAVRRIVGDKLMPRRGWNRPGPDTEVLAPCR